MKPEEYDQGLRGGIERCKGYPIHRKMRIFHVELRYAMQRAWRGYDDREVYDLGHSITRRITVLLKEFEKRHYGSFVDFQNGSPVALSPKETDAIINKMIFYFCNCDEDCVRNRLSYSSGICGRAAIKEIGKELHRCRRAALKLFSRWCWQLWC